MLETFDSQWGNGSDVMTYKEGSLRQIQGFRPELIMMTVLDQQCKMIDGIPETRHIDI